jgi:hypothetical protein
VEFDDEVRDTLERLPPDVAAAARRFAETADVPLGPNDPRRHHFVSQFYLRRFAQTRGKTSRIATIPLDDPQKHRVASVGDTAVIADFYTIVRRDGTDTAAVEKALAQMEAAAHDPLERLAYGVLFPPQERDKYFLSMWLALQFVRDPHARRQQEAIFDSFIKMHLSLVVNEDAARRHLRDRDGQEPTDDEVEGLLVAARATDSWETVISQNNLIQLMMESIDVLAPHLFSRAWCVVRFPEEGLVTCDRPIALYQQPENRQPLMGIGVATADEVIFPLDRTNLLVMHNYPDIGEHVIPADPSQTIADCNQMIVHNARHEVYAHPDDIDAVLALDLPDPDRPLSFVDGGAWLGPYPDGINAPPRRRNPRRYNAARNVPRAKSVRKNS